MLRLFKINGHQGRLFSDGSVKVRIYHRVEDRYLSASNGEQIKEELPLQEFLSRIYRDSENPKYHIEGSMYEISKVLDDPNRNVEKIKRYEQMYDDAYSRIIREGKLVLPQHAIMSNQYDDKYRGYVDPFQGKSHYQRDVERQTLIQLGSLGQAHIRNPGQLSGIIQDDPAVKKIEKEARLKATELDKKKRENDDIYYLLT